MNIIAAIVITLTIDGHTAVRQMDRQAAAAVLAAADTSTPAARQLYVAVSLATGAQPVSTVVPCAESQPTLGTSNDYNVQPRERAGRCERNRS